MVDDATFVGFRVPGHNSYCMALNRCMRLKIHFLSRLIIAVPAMAKLCRPLKSHFNILLALLQMIPWNFDACKYM